MPSKPPISPGRTPKLNDSTQQLIVDAIMGGNYRNIAAGYAGIAPETLTRWMERGEAKPGSLYGRFRQAVLKAEADAHAAAVALVMAAAKDDPAHAKWWLARKFPEQWADKSRLQVEGVAGGAPIVVQKVDVKDLQQPAKPLDEEGKA